MTAATPWAAISWWNELALRPGCTYARAATHALGDACEERVPIADAAGVGEGESRKSRMGRPEDMAVVVDRRPSEAVQPRVHSFK